MDLSACAVHKYTSVILLYVFVESITTTNIKNYLVCRRNVKVHIAAHIMHHEVYSILIHLEDNLAHLQAELK